MALGATEESEDHGAGVRQLYESLSDGQKNTVVLPWNDWRRLHVGNNWHVVRQRIGRFYSEEQQEIIRGILKSVTSEEGYEKIIRSMVDNAGGFRQYAACIFKDGSNKLSFMLTGRHLTIRADGGSEPTAVFGGPMFYGHAVTFNERPDHPGNLWWHQARLASKVYYALDLRQQDIALVHERSPRDTIDGVRLQGQSGKFNGIPVSELSGDQKGLVKDVIGTLLEPYRTQATQEVYSAINDNGGLDKLHLTFYEDGDLPDKNGVWDRWKLEGPAFLWYFRGSPHVHTWINIKNQV